MSTVIASRPSPARDRRAQAIAWCERNIAKFERDLATSPRRTDAQIAHHAIVAAQIVDENQRLERLRSAV